MKTKIVDIAGYDAGLRLLEDSASAKMGSARYMQNILISDRNGISKRPGTVLLGSLAATSDRTTGFSVYKKAFGGQEIPLRANGTKVEYYHSTAGWTLLEDGFTAESEFDFKEHIRNIDNEDYVYMGNKSDFYRRWNGAYTSLNGALSGGETTVTVDGVLKSAVIGSFTATSNSATTVTVSGSQWATDQWRNFYILIKAGGSADSVRIISSNTADTITFATLGVGPGNVAFEIRQLAIPPSGSLVIGEEVVAYSAVPTQYTITTSAIVSAHADNSPVTTKPTAFPGAPKGNRMEVNLDRMIIGNVSSAVSRDSSGNIQGSTSPLSVYVSKLRNASDFTFSATRVAGEGDIISFPEGSERIMDIANQEESFYVFTRTSIGAVGYSQGSDDVAVKTPIKSGTGAIGRVIKGENDIYFVTPDKKISSIGRAAQKDILPEVENIGLSIKRLTDTYNFDDHRGAKFGQRIFHTCKLEGSEYNDRTLVYNELSKSYEGLWTLGAFDFATYDNGLYYASSRNPNVYKMFEGVNDVEDGVEYPITSVWEQNWMNLTPSKSNMQSVHGWFVEGFIWPGTENIEFSLYKDYSTSPSYSFSFGVNQSAFLDNSVDLSAYFGGGALGLTPIGTLGEVNPDGSRHFAFIVYFPFVYGNFFSIGVANSELNAKFDITRQGLAVSDEPEFASTRILT